MDFTVEEENLISIFNTDNRNELIANIREAMPYFEESVMCELAEGVLKKLNELTDAEFAGIKIYPA